MAKLTDQTRLLAQVARNASKTLHGARLRMLRAGLAELPTIDWPTTVGTKGEQLAMDEYTVWKRVLNYRVTRWLQPARILETHPGRGVGTAIYRHAWPDAEIVSCQRWEQDVPPLLAARQCFDLIDIDPHGRPYTALAAALPLLAECGVLLVTNGEPLLVSRGIKRGLYAPTRNIGVRLPRWVREEYVPRLGHLTGCPVRFWYAFPSSIRAICTQRSLPAPLTAGCPVWMRWLGAQAEPPDILP